MPISRPTVQPVPPPRRRAASRGAPDSPPCGLAAGTAAAASPRCRPIAIRAVASALAVAAALVGCDAARTPDQSLAAAEAALTRGDAATAAIEAKNALQDDPASARGRRLLGDALLRSGDAAGAVVELRKAVEADVGDPADDAVVLLASALLRQGRHDAVVAEFADTALGSPAANAALQTTLAAAWAAADDRPRADAAIAAALRAVPDHAAARLWQARAAAAAGDAAAALAGVDAVVERHPGEVDAWLLKGDLLRDGGRVDEALAAYRRGAELRPDLAAARLEVAATLLLSGRADDAATALAAARRETPQTPRLVYLEAVLALQRDDVDGAAARAEALVAAAPSNPRYLLLAGDVALRARRLDTARARLAQALLVAPESVLARRLLARTHLARGDAAQAAEVLQPLLDGGRPDAATALLAGDVARERGDARAAATWFAAAAHARPGDDRARTSLAIAHLAAGDGARGIGTLREIARSAGGIAADLALIRAHVGRGEVDAAHAAIDALALKMPGSPVPDDLRGRARIAAKDLPGARRSFDRALAAAPDHFPSIDGLAAVDLLEGRPQAAQQRFEAVLARQPRHAAALLALAHLRGSRGAPTAEVAALLTRAIAAHPAAPQPRLRLVDLHLGAGDAAAAVATAQDAVAALPDDAAAVDALGRAQLARGATGPAVVAFRKAVAMQPRSAQALQRLATAQHAAGDRTGAADSLRRTLALQPDRIEAHRGLATLAVEARDPARAVAIARTVQSQHPRDPAGYLIEGEVEAIRRQWPAAVAAYRRGLEQIPGSTELGRLAHAAIGASGDAAARDRFAAQWLDRHPRDAMFRVYLGDAAAAGGHWPAAEAMYAAAVQLQPDHAGALNNLAWVGGRLGRADAIGHAERAVAIAPRNATYLDTLAMLLAQRDEPARALSVQRQALALQPGNSLFRLNLARILIAADRRDEARRELQSLAELGDRFRGRSEVERLLRGL